MAGMAGLQEGDEGEEDDGDSHGGSNRPSKPDEQHHQHSGGASASTAAGGHDSNRGQAAAANGGDDDDDGDDGSQVLRTKSPTVIHRTIQPSKAISGGDGRTRLALSLQPSARMVHVAPKQSAGPKLLRPRSTSKSPTRRQPRIIVARRRSPQAR